MQLLNSGLSLSVSQPGVGACQVSGMALIGLTLQALSRAMDLAPHHHQILQEVQEAKTHLTLQQLAEVGQTTCQSPALSNDRNRHCIVTVRMIANRLSWCLIDCTSVLQALWCGDPKLYIIQIS